MGHCLLLTSNYEFLIHPPVMHSCSVQLVQSIARLRTRLTDPHGEKLICASHGHRGGCAPIGRRSIGGRRASVRYNAVAHLRLPFVGPRADEQHRGRAFEGKVAAAAAVAFGIARALLSCRRRTINAFGVRKSRPICPHVRQRKGSNLAR